MAILLPMLRMAVHGPGNVAQSVPDAAVAAPARPTAARVPWGGDGRRKGAQEGAWAEVTCGIDGTAGREEQTATALLLSLTSHRP
jgi:hypothetical protein